MLDHGRRRVSLVIPFYNEEENVDTTLREIGRFVDRERYEWEVVAVNDGSRDHTLSKLQAAQPDAFELVVVDLSRNFGKEAALSAGLSHATGEAIIPLDADLQDPPALLPALLEKWEEGFDVVLARRADRSQDGFLKRSSAVGFYRVMNWLSEVKIPENVGDFRLMDRRVVEVVGTLPESRRFMKGLFAWAGFRTTSVDYVRPERLLGSSKFSGWRLWNFALEGITSFSITPLKVWTYVGFLVALSAFFYGGYIVLRTVLQGVDVPGYASLITIVLFMSGLQLIGLGVIGEYLGRVYLETKRRPPYVVRSVQRSPVAQAPSPSPPARMSLPSQTRDPN